MKKNCEHKRQYSHFSLYISFTNAIDLHTQARNKYFQGPFGQIFRGMGRIPNGYIPFLPMESAFTNSLTNS